MKKVVVFNEPMSLKYSVSRLSFTYIIVVLSNILVLILPFYLFAATDGDFWIIYGTFREQPDVKFLYKFIMVLEATSSTTGQTKEIFTSTMDYLNVLRPESHRSASIQSHENDVNLDGKFDSFTLEANVPLAADEVIHSVQALLFFNLRLHKRVKLDMESLAYTSVNSVAPIDGFDSKGSLMLRQMNPLGIRSYLSTLYAEDSPLLGLTDATSTRRVTNSNIGNVLQKYRDRDVAADYVERYPIKTRGIDSGKAGTFHLKMTVDIPEQEILYIATLAEVLKDGWIKYLSLVALCWFMLERIKSFAFRNHLIPSTVSSNLPSSAKAKTF